MLWTERAKTRFFRSLHGFFDIVGPSHTIPMRQDELIGRKVADRFTITRFLGEGGMAVVYAAEQDREPREVALKIMNHDLTKDRTFVRRFQREAEAAARV